MNREPIGWRFFNDRRLAGLNSIRDTLKPGLHGRFFCSRFFKIVNT